LTDVRLRTPRDAALKRPGHAADETFVDLHARTTGATAGVAA